MTRNVVLVTYDSLRADHCSFMGYERETTPHLDAMAADGLVFENAVASGVPTVASMTAVMTGEHSLASPELGNVEAQREQITTRPTIAETLSDAGYSTGAVVPNPPASSYFGFDEGFDRFEDFLAGDRGAIERAWQRVFRRSMRAGGTATYLRLVRNVIKREEVLRPWEAHYDRITEWRDSIEEPYFLWVLLLEPHHPWLPPAAYQRWSSRWDKYRSFRHYWEMLASGWEPGFDATVRRRLVNLYDDSIRHGDAFLGRLQADLAGDDPVYIVHADHGEEFGEHGRYGHEPYLTEPLIHVPLVIGNADRRGHVPAPVGLRRIAPTVADVAGVSRSRRLPSLFETDRRPWAVSKVFAEGHRRAAVRARSGKYVTENGREALYDLRTDPLEQDNRIGASPDGRAAFRDALARHVATEHEKRAVRTATSEVDKR